MNSTLIWLTIVGMGLITYALRLSMIVLLGRVQIPDLMRRALRFVPPAVLSAIILPELVRPGGARLAAGIVAAAVAWQTKNTFLTVAAGLVTLWILQVVVH